MGRGYAAACGARQVTPHQRGFELLNFPSASAQLTDYDEAIEDHRAINQIAKHATNALSAAGLDGEWWAYQVGCTRGYELVVLAASNLVDKDTEWDEQAFQSWVEAMGCPQAA